jgi:hypothetical protein
MTRLTIKKFDPSTMKRHRIILFVGKRGTGKSILLNDIMHCIHDKVDFGLAMTPTEETAETFREHMPEQWIYSNFEPAKLDAMLRLQRDLGKQKKMRDLFVCMDDCMYDKKVLKGVGMRDLFMNGRHLHVTLFNAMQYVMDMGPDLRSQVDYVFALRENIISNKQKLWKYFFGMFETYNDFSKVMDKCTENFSALVLDNTAKSNNMEDCIFWYRADLNIGPYKMGKPKFWKLATRCNKTEEEKYHEEREKRSLNKQESKNKKKGIAQIQMKDENGKLILDESDDSEDEGIKIV